MTYCKFINAKTTEQCDNEGIYRKKSESINWPVDYEYLCDRHYRSVQKWLRTRGFKKEDYKEKLRQHHTTTFPPEIAEFVYLDKNNKAYWDTEGIKPIFCFAGHKDQQLEDHGDSWLWCQKCDDNPQEDDE